MLHVAGERGHQASGGESCSVRSAVCFVHSSQCFCCYRSLHFLFTESQNHRTVGVGRDLHGSSSPTLLLKQGHLQHAAEDLVQASLEYPQRRRLHSLPGQKFC